MQNERNLVYGVYANMTTKTFSVVGMTRAVKTKKARGSENSLVREPTKEIPMLGFSTVTLCNRSLNDGNKEIVSTRWNFLMLNSLEDEKHKVKKLTLNRLLIGFKKLKLLNYTQIFSFPCTFDFYNISK